MKTFRFKTIEKEITEREYFLDAESREEAIKVFQKALDEVTAREYLNNETHPECEAEYVDSCIETDSDGNAL